MINIVSVIVIAALIIFNVAVLAKSDEIKKPRHKVVYAGITFVLALLLITNIVLICMKLSFTIIFLLIEYLAVALLEISMLATVRPELTKIVLIIFIVLSVGLFGVSRLYNYINITVEEYECVGWCEKATGFKETKCKLFKKVNDVLTESEWYCEASYGVISNGVSVTSDTTPQNITFNK